MAALIPPNVSFYFDPPFPTAPTSMMVTLNGAQLPPIPVPDYSVPLLYMLRNHVGLKSPKFGCGFGQCGACSVIIPTQTTQPLQAARTCQIELYKIAAIATKSTPLQLLTLEGLGSEANPHPLQSAFIDKQAGQCAYCANAMIMGAYVFLLGRITAGNTQVPSDYEVRQFLSNTVFTNPYPPHEVSPTPYLCRCGAHARIIRAIQHAAKGMR